MRLYGLILAMLLLTAIGGCTRQYRLDRDNLAAETPWPFHHGQLDGTGIAGEVAFGGNLSEIWRHGVSGKPAGPLTIYNNQLMFPSTRKKIRVYSLVDGKFRGKIKTRGAVQTGVAVVDSLAIVGIAPRKTDLRAINMLNGKTVWKRKIKDVCPGSIIVNSVLIVSFTDGSVLGLDVKSGETVWQYQADQRLAAPPTAVGTTIYQPGDQGRLYLLDASDGRELNRFDFDAPLVAPVVVGDAVYMTDLEGGVYALDKADGHPLWKSTLDGPIWSAGALGSDRLIVTHSGGGVVALDLIDGLTLWKSDAESNIKASPIIVGQYVIVGTAAGQVICLDLSNGVETSRFEVKGSIDFSPVTDGSRVYVATDEGRIVCLGEQDEYAQAQR